MLENVLLNTSGCTRYKLILMRSAFYEKNGFIAEKYGISPPPESEPDVEYHWRKH